MKDNADQGSEPDRVAPGWHKEMMGFAHQSLASQWCCDRKKKEDEKKLGYAGWFLRCPSRSVLGKIAEECDKGKTDFSTSKYNQANDMWETTTL